MKKLTDKQKSRLWEQQRNVNFQASCLLEKGKGPAEPQIESLELGPSAPGLPHLCLIHRHLYRREMKQAGEFRTADISKGDTPFCHFEYIEKMGNDLMEALEYDKYLVGLSKAEFTDRISHYYCEINMLHPFMSGNGISQRIFFEQLAIHAGYVLDWRDIDPAQWVAANQSGAMGELTALNAIFAKVVSEARESE
ncbi:putative adenosine monophosphate-protein transferase Fic [Enterobacter huaxiensis]|uniref:protein adenylyltransferase n=1 Tax=Enterobacter huaxiensis TaxID=2494702 RepID=A0ABU6EUP8_9ENTR|nr:putative adenosine monophosphate-protein transferase Fic [Enterobacter huaxiensis]MEB7544798.1 putative adenosine monophosphate-protein transferase Fic [Enterobacter huaxiensis]MEB7583095.1 putative adenosine monophosphate-protein transferase Fic [Enterobacter huaxiensis]MEB7665250.1 putative adenosine monophosphate-protein transferase Fic [Enterobacter huaxiensis]